MGRLFKRGDKVKIIKTGETGMIRCVSFCTDCVVFIRGKGEIAAEAKELKLLKEVNDG